MKVEKLILKFIQDSNPNTDVIGLRGLVKTNENEWSFRYVYREGDYISISEIQSIKFEDGVGELVKKKKSSKIKKQIAKK